jgi:hypothetical protein
MIQSSTRPSGLRDRSDRAPCAVRPRGRPAPACRNSLFRDVPRCQFPDRTRKLPCSVATGIWPQVFAGQRRSAAAGGRGGRNFETYPVIYPVRREIGPADLERRDGRNRRSVDARVSSAANRRVGIAPARFRLMHKTGGRERARCPCRTTSRFVGKIARSDVAIHFRRRERSCPPCR